MATIELGSIETTRRIDRTTPLDALPETLTVDELARVLGVGRTLAYELARTDPRLRGVRFGRLVRIPRSALIETLREGK